MTEVETAAEYLRAVYLASTEGILWAVCGSFRDAVRSLDAYADRCMGSTSLHEDWVNLSVPEAEPRWVRYLDVELVPSPVEQSIRRMPVRVHPFADEVPS